MHTRAALRNRLKLRQLNLLAVLSELGSLHKAAIRLGLSQPAATRLLQDLEETMGGPLFDRTKHGLQATDMGRLLMRHASMLVTSIDQVYEEALALQQGNVGSLKVGIFPGAYPTVLPLAIRMLKNATPMLEIQVQEGPQEGLLARLREGDLQLVIGRDLDVKAAQDLQYEILARESFSVVCSPQHALAARRESFELRDLIEFRWILPLPGSALRSALDMQFIEQCLRMPADVVESISVQTNLGLMRHDARLAVMPNSISRFMAGSQLMHTVIAQVSGLFGPMSMAMRAAETQPQHVRRLADALRAVSASVAESIQADAENVSVPPKI